MNAPLTKAQQLMVANSMTVISKVSTAITKKYKCWSREDVFGQVCLLACEVVRTWDKNQASFRTYLYQAAMKHFATDVTKAVKEQRRGRALLGGMVETAGHHVDQGDTLNEADGDISARLDLIRHSVAASAVLDALGIATKNPELEILEATERLRIHNALNEILEGIAPEDRAVIDRRFFQREPLTAIFGPAGSREYRAGWDKHAKVLQKINEEFWVRGIGPATAKRYGGER